jgi:membrane-bound serine protease (ClpP class)
MPPPPPTPPGTPAPTDPKAPPQPGWRQNFAGQKIENFMAAYAESIARERGRNVEFAAKAVRESIAISGGEAVKEKVVDLIAEDVDALLKAIDGREVKVGGKPVVLASASARIQRIEMTWAHRMIQYLASPMIASLLLLAGILGLYAEFSAPGGFVFGLLGAACLVLAAFGLGYLPFSSLGLVLMLAGVVLMVTELFVPAFGLVFAAGVVCLGLGAYLLFDVPEIGDVAPPFWSTVFPSLLVVAALGGLMVYAVSRTIFHPVFAGSGADGVVGQIAVVDSSIEPRRRGRVRLQGELWNAESAERIETGERVRIEEVRDLVVRVARIPREENKT